MSDSEFQEENSNKYMEVRVKLFNNKVEQISVINLATSQKEHINANQEIKIRLNQGRGYFIPVDVNINSDEFWYSKIPSNISSKMNICSVKDGYAYVVPIQHGTILENNQLLCMYWNS